MSTAALFSAERGQTCILAAVRDVLTRLHPEVAARWLDCSTDTVDRVIRGEECEARWTTARTCRLVAAERSVLGTCRLAGVIADVFGSVAPPEAKSLSGEVRSSIPILLDLVKAEAVAVSDGVVSDTEIRAISGHIPHAIEHLQSLAAACAIRLERMSHGI